MNRKSTLSPEQVIEGY